MLMKPKFTRMNDYEENSLRLLAMELSIGSTDNSLTCPHCGESGSFSVTRELHGLLYNCFRASCGVAGFVHSMAATTYNEQPARKKQFEANPFKGDLENVPDDVLRWLLDTYEITVDDVANNGWMYDPAGKRLAMPITNLYKYRAGLCCKKLPGSTYGGQKAVNYWEVDDKVRLSFPYTEYSTPAIVVTEDIMSATKLATMINSASLLGTEMTATQAAFLATNYEELIIMLDPDATHKAIDIKNKYGMLFNSVSVVVMDKDPKDTPAQELLNKLEAL